MATIREYFDTDFNYATRMSVRLRGPGGSAIEGAVLFDFAANGAFLACFVEAANHKDSYFRELLSLLDYGNTPLEFTGMVRLPSARQFPGEMKVENKDDFEILARYFGEPDWISTKQIQSTRRVFIYSETQLSVQELLSLKDEARKCGHELQYRSTVHATQRSKFEKPLAFISHDSRDKEAVAKKLAIGLQKFMCPVWYDEFSLKVGDNLRDKIETGLKECKKCIVVLSPNFLSNKGWTKKEFDSIFVRGINEKEGLVLPVWVGVSAEDVFEYCPSLQMVKGLDWNKLGEDEVARQLASVILNE